MFDTISLFYYDALVPEPMGESSSYSARAVPTDLCGSDTPKRGVKIVIFAASIALGFSVNGSTQDRLENLTGQTILVQKPRTLQNLGLGIQELSDKANFSQEMLFLQG